MSSSTGFVGFVNTSSFFQSVATLLLSVALTKYRISLKLYLKIIVKLFNLSIVRLNLKSARAFNAVDVGAPRTGRCICLDFFRANLENSSLEQIM